jgi:hypothetical protein
MKKRSILLVLLTLSVFMIVVIGAAQTRDEFKQKYGPPDTKGRYTVRPNIGLSIKYKQSRNLSEMIIEPLESTASQSNFEKEGSNEVMPLDMAEEVLDELIPVAESGKKGYTGIAEFGCTSVEYTDYEEVSTSIAKRCEQQEGGTYSISVRWKK